jgi:hypothetical protein
MDNYLSWTQLSLMQQLNCICNTLAKRAVTTATTKDYHNRPAQLPTQEDIALIVWGIEILGDISETLQFHASKAAARTYLQQRKKTMWTSKQFEEVDWEHLELAMKNKAVMFKIWQSKQNSGFSGTRSQVGVYLGVTFPDEQCPNCGAREMDAHLMLCPD